MGMTDKFLELHSSRDQTEQTGLQTEKTGYEFFKIINQEPLPVWSEVENIYPESIGVSSELSEEYILKPAWSNHDQTSEMSSDSGSHSYQSSGYFQSPSRITFGQTGRPPREPDSALTPEELTRRNRRRARNREAACRQRDRRLEKVRSLQDEIKDLESDGHKLKTENTKLNEERMKLKAQLEILNSPMWRHQQQSFIQPGYPSNTQFGQNLTQSVISSSHEVNQLPQSVQSVQATVQTMPTWSAVSAVPTMTTIGPQTPTAFLIASPLAKGQFQFPTMTSPNEITEILNTMN